MKLLEKKFLKVKYKIVVNHRIEDLYKNQEIPKLRSLHQKNY